MNFRRDYQHIFEKFVGIARSWGETLERNMTRRLAYGGRKQAKAKKKKKKET